MKLFALLTALLAPAAATAAEIPTQNAAEIAKMLRAQSGAPGIGVAIWDGDQVQIATDGLREIGHPAPLQEGDLWHIGSNTKSMTATLIARLVEQGHLRWSTTIGAVLGDQIPQMRDVYRDATLRDLLTHRSGLPANDRRWTLIKEALAFDPAAPAPGPEALHETRMAYAARLLARRPSGPNGTFTYSNAGYVIAGLMAETVMGASWEALMAQELFTPLGLLSAGFGPPTRDPAQQPQGHGGMFGKCEPLEPTGPADNLPVLGPAGRVHLSLADHMRYLQAHVTQPTTYLQPESWAMLHEPVGDYAMGWGVSAPGVLEHAGSNTMWMSVLRIDTNRPFAVILNANCARQEPLTAQVNAIFQARAER